MTSETRIEIAPHCSLTPRGARWFLVSVCIASLSIALPISLLGFWLVLPFAGLEIALLAWALRTSMARRHQRQTITISETVVVIEDVMPPLTRCVEFPRHWAQVRIRGGGSPLHPSRLTVESHGRRHEIGFFLNEQERLGLAARLRRLIGRVDESPPLPKQTGAA
ncbi:MAG: DUF2244 domain-containing protein [Gammaproteobacteria bacterium]|nr:DUF2244 domain-containing protein [Gammaproteobacteria bacterium]